MNNEIDYDCPFVIMPGEWRAVDGDIHFITSQQLIELYRVKKGSYLVYKATREGRILERGKIKLYPWSNIEHYKHSAELIRLFYEAETMEIKKTLLEMLREHEQRN